MSNEIPPLLSESINHTDFNYLLYNDDSDAPAMVMIHATGFIPWLWHPLAREFSKTYRVIVPCLSSHRTPHETKNSISWEILADDIYTLLKKLGIEKAYLVGHSMGGTIATLLNSHFSFPAEKMVLIEPIYLPREIYGMPISIEDHHMASKAIKRRDGWKNINECREYFLSKPFFQKWDKEILELYLAYGLVDTKDSEVKLYCSPKKEAALFLGGSEKDPWPLIPKITCPVMILEGETTENKLFINYTRTAKLFQNGTHKELAGMGHLIPMEAPQKTLQIIKIFFNSGLE